MSNYTQIYNQGFNIEASLVNADVKNNPQYLPLKYGAIKYMEITDLVSSASLSGFAILDNYNDLINSSPVFNFANLYNNFFNFKAEQIIGPNAKVTYDASFVLNTLYTLPLGEVDSEVHIGFEDIFFGTLKNKTINDASQVSRYKSGLVSTILRNIFADYNQFNESMVGNWLDTSNNVNLQFDPSSSIYDIFDLAYRNNFTSNTGSYNDAIFNLLKCEGDFWTGANCKYHLEPINRKFLDLYSSLKSGVVDVSKCVTEGFMESGARPEDQKTGFIRGFNEITELQVIRPDPVTIRETYRNIVIESVSDQGSSLIDVLPIVQSLNTFYKLFCNNPNYRLDIPFNPTALEDPTTMARNARKVSAYYPELEPGNTQAKIYNTLLLNSKAITFRVKGQLYRKSGMFIYFQPKRQSGNDKHYNSLVGFWYIVKVQHIFDGDTYDNVITCVNPFVRNN